MINAPRFVSIEPSGKDSVKICAGADEEQHDHEEGLELEDAEHFCGICSVCLSSVVTSAWMWEMMAIMLCRVTCGHME